MRGQPNEPEEPEAPRTDKDIKNIVASTDGTKNQKAFLGDMLNDQEKN
jgi:hypothetical protein